MGRRSYATPVVEVVSMRLLNISEGGNFRLALVGEERYVLEKIVWDLEHERGQWRKCRDI